MNRFIRKYKYHILWILLALGIASCVYDYTPEDASLQGLDSPLLVVDGDIVVGDVTRVKLSYTESILEDEADMPLGVTVMVESESGETVSAYALDEEPGVYEADTRELDMDVKYRLFISVPGRGEYVSEFKPVMISPPIDEITWSIAPDSTYANIEVTTHNTEEGKLYCKWNFTENWESNSVFVPFLEYIPSSNNIRDLTQQEQYERRYCFSEAVSNDVCVANTERLSENLISKYVLKQIANTDTRVNGLYAITVTQKALDKEAYQYWETLKKNMGETGGLFSAQPSEYRGNIRSLTNADEIVLGYTSVSTTHTVRQFIDWKSEQLFKTDCDYIILDGDILWYHYYSLGYRPVFRVEDEGMFWSQLKCVDCRSYSNSTKPGFWPDKENESKLN